MGFIIAVFSLVTDHRGLPRTIARANNFVRAITSYAGALVAIRVTVSFFFLLQSIAAMSGTTNGQLTLINSHVFRKPPFSARFPFQQHLHLQENRNARLRSTYYPLWGYLLNQSVLFLPIVRLRQRGVLRDFVPTVSVWRHLHPWEGKTGAT